MMSSARGFPILLSLLLAACGGSAPERSTSQDLRTSDAGESGPAPSAPPQRQAGQAGQASPLPVSAPRIAYSYGYTFRLSPDRLVAVQEQHLALCRSLGDARCRVVNLQRSAASGDYLTASTTLQVASAIAPAFGQRLVASATQAGAETVDRSISGEDLSRQMVDTEARIRTRETLIRRLTELLESRSGNIQQAVEAERAITTAQEELDAARGWLAEMRTRVDMSQVTIAYQSGRPLGGGVGEPIDQALGEVGSLFARSVAAMILAVGLLLPWAMVAAIVLLALRSWRRRRRALHAAELPPAAPAQGQPDAGGSNIVPGS